MVRIELLPADIALLWMDNNQSMLADFTIKSQDSPDFLLMAQWIKSRDALLGLLVNSAQDTVGFIVIAEQKDPSGKELFIWALYSRQRLSRDDYINNLDYLCDVAKQIKADTIRFRTKRKSAWNRKLATISFDEETAESFVQEVH